MFVLICGCPRSGTTELVRYLNKHESIALGCERYLYRYNDAEGVGPDYFEPERFNTLRPGDTFWESLREMPGWSENFGSTPVKEKIGQTRIFGDKAPDQIFHLNRTLPKFLPQAKVIICVRDILSVIRSWQMRADDAADNRWSRSEGAESGIRHWTGSIASLIEYSIQKLPVLDVYMPDLYSESKSEASRLFDFLELDFDKPSELALHAGIRSRIENGNSPDRCKIPTYEERSLIVTHPYVQTIRDKLRSSPYRIPLDRLFWLGFEQEFDCQPRVL